MVRTKVGDKHELLCGSIATVIEYKNSGNIKILTNTGYECIVIADNLIKGVVKDRLYRSFNEKGYLGVGDYNTKSKCFTSWGSMIRRSYSLNYKDRFPAYKDADCCNEWHDLQNYGSWFDENYVEGWHLDKDLKVYGNKTYSPDTCTFVPREVNNFFFVTENKRLPHGVKNGGIGYSNGLRPKVRYSVNDAQNDYWNEKYKRLIFLTQKYNLLSEMLFDYFYCFFGEHYVENPDEI